MGKVKWAVVVLVVFAVGAGTGWLARGHSWQPAPKGKYGVRAHCTNCDWAGTVYVTKGESVVKVACQRCERWRPAKPELLTKYGEEWENELDAVIAKNNWERERESSLVTQGNWELRKAHVARR